MIIGHWELRGFGLWAVEERATGRLLGRIGCHEPEGWPGFELGYALARDAWGQGFAREGASAALDYARRELARDVIISLIRPANRASIAVAEHFGARRTGSVEFFGAPTDVYTYPVSA
jgi:RimJ/RimL family protein N-acetyltransferase